MCKTTYLIIVTILSLAFVPLAISNPDLSNIPGLSSVIRCDSSRLRQDKDTYYCTPYPKFVSKDFRLDVWAAAYANGIPVKANISGNKELTLKFVGQLRMKSRRAKRRTMVAPRLSVRKKDLPPGVRPDIELIIFPYHYKKGAR